MIEKKEMTTQLRDKQLEIKALMALIQLLKKVLQQAKINQLSIIRSQTSELSMNMDMDFICDSSLLTQPG